LGQPLERVGGALVAIEGRQFSAVKATGRHGTNATLAPLMAQLDARVEGSRTARAAAEEPDEAGTPGAARAADLQTTSAARRARRRRDKDRQAAVEGRGQAQRALTAPDRRARPGGAGGGPAVCAHVQTAVEAPHQRIGAGAGTPEPTDRDGLSPRAVDATAVLGGPCEAVAEVGDDQGQDVQPGLHVGMTPSMARPITAATQPLGRFSPDEGPDEAAADPDGGPAGAGRRGRVATIALGRHRRDEATAAGRTWRLTAQCTRHPGGRRSTRGVDAPRLEPLAQRVPARPEIMPPRNALVEPPVGTMQRRWTQGSCLRRGVAQVRAALRVTVLADHLRRVLPRVDRPRLLASLGEGGQGGRGCWGARRRDA
jgi:hypothetical protein